MSETTQFYQSNKTQLYDSASSQLHGLQVGDEVILLDSGYTILDIISEDSGEAVIHKIQDIVGQIFALKMYFEFRNEKDEPNAESLKRILKITDSDILKLHYFGVSEHKYNEKYCFEISDFAEGGDLLSVLNFKEKYSSEFIEKRVIPQIFKGIQTLHRHKIFHCDLKPQNVFFRDSEQTNLVIGDYGSAKTFGEENAKDSRKTSTVKGTDFYLSPEQARGFISEKNDFYSFGMILLHLLYPEKICENDNYSRINRQKFRQIIENQFQNKPIIEFEKNKWRLNRLIAGLTLTNVTNRWGAYEVRRWLNGENPEIVYQANEQNKEISPIDLGDRIIQTEADLIKFIETDEEWHELLIEDETGRYLFFKWLISVRGSKLPIENIIQKTQQLGIEFLKESLLRYFQHYRPVMLDDRIYDFTLTDDLIFETARYFGRLLHEDYTSDEINLYIFKYKICFEYIDSTNPKKTILLNTFKEANVHAFPEKHNREKHKDDIFPKLGIRIWLHEVLAQIVQTEHHIVFDKITEEGIHCTKIGSWTAYFAQKNETLPLQNSKETQEIVCSFPKLPFKEDKDGDLIFDDDEVFEAIKLHIKNYLDSEKYWVYANFEALEEQIKIAHPLLWTNSFEEIEVNLIDMRRNGIPFDKDSLIFDMNEPANFDISYKISYPTSYTNNRLIFVDSLIDNQERHFRVKTLTQIGILPAMEKMIKEEFGKNIEVYFMSYLPEYKRIIEIPNEYMSAEELAKYAQKEAVENPQEDEMPKSILFDATESNYDFIRIWLMVVGGLYCLYQILF